VYFIDKFVKKTIQEGEVQRSKGNGKYLAECSILEKESCEKFKNMLTLTD